MLKWNLIIKAALLAAFIAGPLEADKDVQPAAAATQPPSEQAPTPVKTGKERLSSKASDEQRVDNCKVPPKLRGTTARPDSCETKAQAVPTN